MADNLGTIARSGTQGFIEQMKASGKTDVTNIIGQFGVGFYSGKITRTHTNSLMHSITQS